MEASLDPLPPARTRTLRAHAKTNAPGADTPLTRTNFFNPEHEGETPVDDNDYHWLANPGTPSGRAWDAVTFHDYETLAELIQTHGTDCTLPSESTLGHPVTPLTQAARRADTRALHMLLDAGANPNHRASGHTIHSPTHWAIESSSTGCVRMLLQAGARMPEQEDWAFTAILHTPAELVEKYPTILRMVLANSAPATDAAIHAAVSAGLHVAVENLLSHGARPDASHQSFPLMTKVLALGGHTQDSQTIGPRMLAILLNAGASADAPCGPPHKYAPPALAYAIECGSTWAIRPLIAAGADTAALAKIIASDGLRIEHSPHCGPPSAIAAALHEWAAITGSA